MTTAVSAIIATFVTFPLLPWLLVCFVLLRWQPKRKAIRNASDWTLPFFLLAVVFICHELWPEHGAWLAIVFIAVLTVALFLFMHWVHPTGTPKKKTTAAWRSLFLLSSLLYLFLLGAAFFDRVVFA
ncbi:hypothetical protein J26TS2_11970 [Shouchella clausii]|uniref:DUF3397 domain-containing protein n=1 Tax=Shouchella tritolerans TaxID=2979466 RepID=UPI000787D36D|nr:DUF3397 domain-containing protein [Shouchella tritolerans]GIN11330.1 hypothetical protein J26TS2_11970 [Shouchella clausii]